MINRDYWRRGELGKLAAAAQPPLTVSYVSDVLSGRRVITEQMALRLAEAGFRIGKVISPLQWLTRDKGHSAFLNEGEKAPSFVEDMIWEGIL